MKIKYIIGMIVVIVFIAWGATAFLKTTVKYVSFDDARAASGKVQVAGHIDQDIVSYNADLQQLEFEIFEMEPTDQSNPDRLSIVYSGVVPGNFDQATSVVIRGYPENDKFIAEQLLVKCPSKYQGEAVELEG